VLSFTLRPVVSCETTQTKTQRKLIITVGDSSTEAMLLTSWKH